VVGASEGNGECDQKQVGCSSFLINKVDKTKLFDEKSCTFPTFFVRICQMLKSFLNSVDFLVLPVQSFRGTYNSPANRIRVNCSRKIRNCYTEGFSVIFNKLFRTV
jgi:hypothetical protein